MSSYYSNEELLQLGFKSVGQNVMVSKKTSIYGISRIELGDHVRIDDFCFFSAGEGGIKIGSYIHISPFCSMAGKGAIIMEDFSGLSSRVAVYSSSDDYSGASLTNPTVPESYKKVMHGDVILQRHVIIGAGSIILPGVIIGEGTAIGALSLVSKNVDPYKIATGNPLRVIKDRKKDLIELEWKLKNELQ
ncbi:MAG: acyltransferase [Chitinophagaceae bacterium]|nr:acyltransferase [Chitinophagaceae bacterium]